MEKSENTSAALLQAAEEIAQLVQRHALTASLAQDDPGAIVAESQALSKAVGKYNRLLSNIGATGRPFASDEEESDTAEAGTKSKQAPRKIVEMEVKFRFAVRDVQRAVELAHSRARKHGLKSSGVTQDSSASDIVTALFVEDRWKPEEYDQEAVELLSEVWDCR
jgi:hypothetical protein